MEKTDCTKLMSREINIWRRDALERSRRGEQNDLGVLKKISHKGGGGEGGQWHVVPVQERQEPGLAVLLRGCVPSYGKKQGNKDYKQTLAAPVVPLWGGYGTTLWPLDSIFCRGQRRMHLLRDAALPPSV